MKTNQISKKFKYMVASLVAIASLGLMAAAPVAAAAKSTGSVFGPFSQVAITKAVDDSELSAMFQKDSNEATRIIAGVRQQGKAASAKDLLLGEKGTALATSERDLSTVRADLGRDMPIDQLVQTLISTHAGFKANGDVSNRALAEQTVSQLNFLLRNSHFWLQRAISWFQRANQPR